MRNHFYVLFQVGEASFFNYCPIVEAHVRVYAVLHEERRTETAEGGSANERALFQTRVMRLTNPNDELGGMLFLATPQTVSHRIDAWSPMLPPSVRAASSEDPNAHDGAAYHFPGLVFREADREVSIADESVHHSAAAASTVPSTPSMMGRLPPPMLGVRSSCGSSTSVLHGSGGERRVEGWASALTEQRGGAKGGAGAGGAGAVDAAAAGSERGEASASTSEQPEESKPDAKPRLSVSSTASAEGGAGPATPSPRCWGTAGCEATESQLRSIQKKIDEHIRSSQARALARAPSPASAAALV